MGCAWPTGERLELPRCGTRAMTDAPKGASGWAPPAPLKVGGWHEVGAWVGWPGAGKGTRRVGHVRGLFRAVGLGWMQCPLEGTAAPPWAASPPFGLRSGGVSCLEAVRALEGDRDPPGAACLQLITCGGRSTLRCAPLLSRSLPPCPQHTHTSLSQGHETHPHAHLHSFRRTDCTHVQSHTGGCTARSHALSHTPSVTWTLTPSLHTHAPG